MTFAPRRIALMLMAAVIVAAITATTAATAVATIATMAAASTSAQDASALSRDDQVREALFKYLIAHDGPEVKDWARIHFLAIEQDGKRRDPSPALMQRFAAYQPRIEGVSRADITADKGALHRDTGERGVVFTVGAVTRVSDDAVEVECSFFAANLSGSGGTYRVERKDGVWVVLKPKMLWVA